MRLRSVLYASDPRNDTDASPLPVVPTRDATPEAEARMTSGQHRRYIDEVGEDALSRQREEAKLRFVCCGELRDEGHHPLCRNYVEPTQPEHIDGQESLL